MFFLQKWPKKVWFRTKNAQNFQKKVLEVLEQVPNRKILKVTKYQHHMTMFEKLAAENCKSVAESAPPPPPGMNRVKHNCVVVVKTDKPWVLCFQTLEDRDRIRIGRDEGVDRREFQIGDTE